MQGRKVGGRWFAGVVVVGCMALGLGACGRKSALDPPPSAAVPPPAQTGQGGQQGAPPQEAAAAPPSQNRGFILDPLLR